MYNHILIRLAGFTIGLLLCLWGGWSAGAAGLSRLFSRYALATGSLAHADEALLLSPSDPEAHYSRARTLKDNKSLTEAVKEFERATQLRPRYYVFWYELALARDAVNDSDGAIAACEESVRLAPSYGKTHWLLGNLLYRAGRLDEAFTELRRAASSDPEFSPNLIDLAWGTYAGDASAVQAVVQPQTNNARRALAQFFARKGKFVEAIALFETASDNSAVDRRKFLTELLSAKRFKEAYGIWANGRQESPGKSVNGVNQITDPGFEGVIKLNEPGFGWQQTGNIQNVHLSLDPASPQGGTRSLLINYTGNSNPSTPTLSQLVLVEPNTRYILHFFARTKDIVTGGLPQIMVTDASASNESKMLNTITLPQNSNPWRDYSLEFTTPDKADAISINLIRQTCGSDPCPIFGYLWLDDFSLEKI